MAETTLTIPIVGTPNQGNIDVAQVANNSIPSANVLRENVVMADPVNFLGQAQVTNARGLQVDNQMIDLLQAVLIELRTISTILADGLNLKYDPDQVRNDNTLLYDVEQ